MDFKRALLIAALLAPAAACTTAPDSYPSLAFREGERVDGTAEPAPAAPYVPPTPSGDVLDNVGRLAAEATSAHQAFVEEAARLGSTVSKGHGAQVGSDSWAQAQVALASLESARSKSLVALADLDRLYVGAALEGEELTRIAELREQVVALVSEEDATIERLGSGLR